MEELRVDCIWIGYGWAVCELGWSVYWLGS